MQITQEQFNNLPIIDGIKQCPTGDYSQIKSFGDGASFGEWASFDERASFGAGASFGKWASFGARARFGERARFEDVYKPRTINPFMAFDRIGSVNRKTYFFDFVDGVYIRAGCFGGFEKEFLDKLKADGDDHKTKVYLAALSLAKLNMGIEE